MKNKPIIFVLSAKSGAGKTTLCLQTVVRLQHAGVQVAGLVSPARVGPDGKTGILVYDIRSKEQRSLAERHTSEHPNTKCGWRFDPTSLQWGADILRDATPCDVLVVDELGPLEIEQNGGWAVAWEVLAARQFRAALIVVRPSLMESLQGRLPGQPLEIISGTPCLPTAKSLSESILSIVSRE